MAGHGGCAAEAADPFIHMVFEIGGGAESIDPHGAEEVTDAFPRHARGHGDIGGEGGNPGTIVGSAEDGGEDVDDGAEGISFMAAMIATAAQREEGAEIGRASCRERV